MGFHFSANYPVNRTMFNKLIYLIFRNSRKIAIHAVLQYPTSCSETDHVLRIQLFPESINQSGRKCIPASDPVYDQWNDIFWREIEFIFKKQGPTVDVSLLFISISKTE